MMRIACLLMAGVTALSAAIQPCVKANMSGRIDQQTEQAVIAYLKLSDNDLGQPDERDSVHALGEQLERLIKEQQAGEYDGDEFGGGYAKLYMYGPDANKLFAAVIDAIKKHSFRRGSYVIRRFGKPGAKEERIDL